MKSRLLYLFLASSLMATACATAPPPKPEIDPSHDATIVGAVTGAVDGATDAAIVDDGNAIATGRRIGTAVGIVSAIFGGRPYESVDESIDRFRRIRATGEAIGVSVAMAKGASKGWQQGLAFDVEMAELQKIEGVEVTRPFVDQLDIRFPYSEERLRDVACAIGTAERRSLDVEGGGDLPFVVRDVLIDHGIPNTAIQSHRSEVTPGLVVLHLRLLNER